MKVTWLGQAGLLFDNENAARFFYDCGAKSAVPYHVGMFDEISPEIFDVKEKIILEIYKEKEV